MTHMNSIETPELLWQMVEERIKRLRAVDILEWMYHMKPEDPLEDYVPCGG